MAAHAERLLRLQQVYARIAPEHLARSSQVANYKMGKVVIHAFNGAVAAKLKQLAPRLAVEFCEKACEVTGVTVRVQVAVHHDAPARPPAAREISPAARERIERAAAAMNESSALRATLLRLARRSR